MSSQYAIRADYDRDTLVVYQAYNDVIADRALEAGRFVAPFSFHRMTWIKPSFLWLMHRSNWGQKRGQHRTLAIRIRLSGWTSALSQGVLTAPDPRIHGSAEAWEAAFQRAHVHVQWDTERSLRGAALQHYSIQVGLSRHVIRDFVDDWIVEIRDLSAEVAKIRGHLQRGDAKRATRLLPPERLYTPPQAIADRLMIGR